MDVAPFERTRRNVAESLQHGLVARPEVCAAADEFGHDLREGVHHLAARRARGDGLAGLKLRQSLNHLHVVRLGLRGGAVGVVAHPALRQAVLNARAVGEDVVDFLRHEETLFGVESESPLHPGDFLRAERCAVGVGGILFRRCAEADVGRGDNHHGLTDDFLGAAIGLLDFVVVVSVAGEDLPAVALESFLHVVVQRERGVALDRDVVRVVDEDEVVEFHRTRPTAGLVRNALLQVAVAAEDPRAVARLRLLRRERKPDAHRNALTERTRRHLNPRHHPAFGMSRAPRTELTECLQFVHRHSTHPRKVEERVNQRTRVAARKDETVAPVPLRVFRIDIQMPQPQGAGEIRQPHRHAGMPGLRLLNHVRAETADGIRHEFQLFVGNLHRVVYYSITGLS